MDRRNFIKKAGILSAGVFGAPYILPSGRLFAATGNRLVNHVVFCLFAGGVRNLESVEKAEGNLMPGILKGSESISSDLQASMTLLPGTPGNSALQELGTLYKGFRYEDGPTGHFNGHATAVTGQYTNNTISIRDHPPFPTVFELYRKFSDPAGSSTNAWWVTNNNSLYPILNYSNHPDFGAKYGANNISPHDLFQNSLSDLMGNQVDFSPAEDSHNMMMRDFLNNKFGSFSSGGGSFRNDESGASQIHEFISRMFLEKGLGMHSNPWGTNYMSGDMKNVFYAEEIIKEFKPELLLVNMTGVDVAHSNFSGYCDNLRKADWAVSHLWQTIQATPGMANDTLLIVAPEIGRNYEPNTLVDENGRYALDHAGGDAMSRDLFCLVAGPQGVVVQNQAFSQTMGQSIDIVPTVAHALGFYDQAQTYLPGTPLYSSFS